MTPRILHTSDIHLTAPGDRACHSLKALADLVIRSDVSLVIIAGDLFDHNQVGDDLVAFAVNQLRRFPVPAIILPGNHDCLAPNSVYYRDHLWEDTGKAHVIKAVEGELLEFTGLGLTLWGRPIASYLDTCREPLCGIPPPDGNGNWHIAIAHGWCFDYDSVILPSGLPLPEDEAIAARWDYLALGHFANFKCVCADPVKAYYCDSASWSYPQSTVNIVDFTVEAGARITRLPLTGSPRLSHRSN